MTDVFDLSWPQGDYQGAPGPLVGIGAWSLDGGTAFTQSTYHKQVDTARAKGQRVIHYAFNGRTDRVSPSSFADYCYANLYRWQRGDGIALDVESSEQGKYPSWSIVQADQFRARMTQLMAQLGVSLRLGVYGSRSDMGRAGWKAQENLGCWLWIAWPGWTSGSSYGEWSKWYMLQYSTAGGVDHNHLDEGLLSILDSQYSGSATSETGDDMFFYHDPKGAWMLADDFGNVNLSTLADKGVSSGDLINAARAHGAIDLSKDQRSADVLGMMIRNRGNNIMNAIIAGVTAKLTPVIQAQQKVDPSALATALAPGLAAAVSKELSDVEGLTPEQVQAAVTAALKAQKFTVTSN